MFGQIFEFWKLVSLDSEGQNKKALKAVDTIDKYSK